MPATPAEGCMIQVYWNEDPDGPFTSATISFDEEYRVIAITRPGLKKLTLASAGGMGEPKKSRKGHPHCFRFDTKNVENINGEVHKTDVKVMVSVGSAQALQKWLTLLAPFCYRRPKETGLLKKVGGFSAEAESQMARTFAERDAVLLARHQLRQAGVE